MIKVSSWTLILIESGQFAQFLFTVFNLALASVSELWLFICRCVLPDTNKGRDKFTYFIPNYPNSTLICQSYLVYQYHLLAGSFINKQVKSTCCYCFTSICNWWYQEELGFCCREAEPCKTIYGRVCVYMCVQWGCPGRGVWVQGGCTQCRARGRHSPHPWTE